MGNFLSPLRAIYGALFVFLSSVFSSAHAALDPGIGTAITAAQADILEAIGAVILAMVAVWGLKKLGRKMGWL